MLGILRRVFSFADWTQHHPKEPPPGDMLDASFDAQNQKISEIEALVSDLRRSDGALRNDLVGADQLSPDLRDALRIPAARSDNGDQLGWKTAEAEADVWAHASMDWAEHMPDTIPGNSVAVMDITGDHWSSRWWANHAAQIVSDFEDVAVGFEPAIEPGTITDYWRGDKSWQHLDKTSVGLDNVDNTSDPAKPVSTATQIALNLKADIASPTFTGKVTTQASGTPIAGLNVPPGVAPTNPFNGDFWSTSTGFYGRVNGVTIGPFSTASGGGGIADAPNDGLTYGRKNLGWTSLAGGGFVSEAPTDGKQYSRQNAAWIQVTYAYANLTGLPATFTPTAHVHAESEITGLVVDLNAKAPLANPIFTGNPRLTTTPSPGDNDTSLASTAFVTAAVAAQKTTDNADYVNVTGDTMTGALTAPSYRVGTVDGSSAGSGIVLFKRATSGNSEAIYSSNGAGGFSGVFGFDGTGQFYIRAGDAATTDVTVSTAGTITAAGNVLSGGFYASNSFFISQHASQCVLGMEGSGTIYLRPNGPNIGTGQTVVTAAGNMSVTGDVGTGGGVGAGLAGCQMSATGVVSSSRIGTTSTTQHAFYNNNGMVGQISTNGSATTYSTSSDERLKEYNADYDPAEAIAIIRADPVLSFTWKATGDEAVGWFAQRSHAVDENLAVMVPASEGSSKDEIVPEAWGIDYGRRTPYLWAALSNVLDRLEAIEAKLSVIDPKPQAAARRRQT